MIFSDETFPKMTATVLNTIDGFCTKSSVGFSTHTALSVKKIDFIYRVAGLSFSSISINLALSAALADWFLRCFSQVIHNLDIYAHIPVSLRTESRSLIQSNFYETRGVRPRCNIPHTYISVTFCVNRAGSISG